MRSITVGELKEIFNKYNDETEVFSEYEGGKCSISSVTPETKINIDTLENEVYLILE